MPLKVALESFLPDFIVSDEVLSKPEGRNAARSALVHELRRLRGFDTYPPEVLQSIGREQLHLALSALESACVIMNSGDSSLIMNKNIGK